MNRDDVIDWHEFVSFMILGFKNEDPAGQKETLSLPITDKPDVFLANHRNNIVSIEFVPNILPDGSLNYTQGGYRTVGNDGTINYWNPQWDFLKSEQTSTSILVEFEKKNFINEKIAEEPKGSKNLILAAVSMPDIRIICITSIRCDLRLFDSSANKCILRMMISNFPSPINSLHYFSSKSAATHCKLIVGDLEGSVYILELLPDFKMKFRLGASVHEYNFSDVQV